MQDFPPLLSKNCRCRAYLGRKYFPSGVWRIVPFCTSLSVIRLNASGFKTPACASVLAVSGERAPHFRNFLMIRFLLIMGIGGQNDIVASSFPAYISVLIISCKVLIFKCVIPNKSSYVSFVERCVSLWKKLREKHRIVAVLNGTKFKKLFILRYRHITKYSV